MPTIQELYLWVEEISDNWAKHFKVLDRDLYTAQELHRRLVEWQKEH